MLASIADQNKFDIFYDLFSKLSANIGKRSYKYWVCGGAITCHLSGNTINDFDFYSDDPKQLISDLTNFCEMGKTYAKAQDFYYEGKLIQVIDCIYKDPIATMTHFDYTICRVAFDGNTLYYDETFWEDLQNKIIRLGKYNPSPLTAYIRLLKYISRGFYPDNDTAFRVIKDISKIPYDWNSPFESC
jgi:hypothetical protein